MNLPNALSLFRIVLAAAFPLFLSLGGEDLVDSWQVRVALVLLNLVTDLGKLLDPLADKILVAAAFVLFTEHRICPGWVTVAILFREFAVTGLRLLLVEKGTVLPADNLGKWKTVTQMVFCVLILLGYSFQTLSFFIPVGSVVMYVALILTLFSGANYLIKGGKALV